jgi:hypothetical protein
LATPPLLCKDGAGLSANLLGVVAHNLSDGVAGLASPPSPSVGCPVLTQRTPLVSWRGPGAPWPVPAHGRGWGWVAAGGRWELCECGDLGAAIDRLAAAR